MCVAISSPANSAASLYRLTGGCEGGNETLHVKDNFKLCRDFASLRLTRASRLACHATSA
jgi:hypothetical protein